MASDQAITWLTGQHAPGHMAEDVALRPILGQQNALDMVLQQVGALELLDIDLASYVGRERQYRTTHALYAGRSATAPGAAFTPGKSGSSAVSKPMAGSHAQM